MVLLDAAVPIGMVTMFHVGAQDFPNRPWIRVMTIGGDSGWGASSATAGAFRKNGCALALVHQSHHGQTGSLLQLLYWTRCEIGLPSGVIRWSTEQAT